MKTLIYSISLQARFFDFFLRERRADKDPPVFCVVLCFAPDIQGEAAVTVTLTCTVSGIVVSCEVVDQGKPVWTGQTWLHQLWRSLEELQPNTKQILILLWDGTKVNGCNKKIINETLIFSFDLLLTYKKINNKSHKVFQNNMTAVGLYGLYHNE